MSIAESKSEAYKAQLNCHNKLRYNCLNLFIENKSQLCDGIVVTFAKNVTTYCSSKLFICFLNYYLNLNMTRWYILTEYVNCGINITLLLLFKGLSLTSSAFYVSFRIPWHFQLFRFCRVDMAWRDTRGMGYSFLCTFEKSRHFDARNIIFWKCTRFWTVCV